MSAQDTHTHNAVDGDDSEEIEYYNIPWTDTYRLNATCEKERGAELRALRANWTWKDDDVIIHGSPRAGSHLTWNLTRYIVQGSTEWFPDPMEDSHWCVFGLKDVQKGRRVLTTHYKPVDFGDNFWPTNGKRKHIVIMRNWKDVAVSYYILIKQLGSLYDDQGPFDAAYLKEFCYGQVALGNWFAIVRGWEEYTYKHPEHPIMLIFYEDIVADLVSAVRKIAHFLDCPISEQLVQEIARKCEFKEMKKQPLSVTYVEKFKEGADSSSENLFYRKGKVGDWKNHFTVQQNEWGDAAYKNKMKGSKLRFRYE